MKALLVLRQVIVPLLTLIALGCDGDQPPPKLDLLPAAPTKADAEAERLRKMQLITVIVDGVPRTMDDLGFQTLVRKGCEASLACVTPTDSGGGSCDDACAALIDTCEAKTYLALTRPQGQLVTLPNGADLSTNQVPEQDETAKQKLAQLGLVQATFAADILDRMLQTFSGIDTFASFSCDATTKSVPFHETPLSAFAANSFADIYDIYKQLADAFVKASLNSADSEFDSTPSTSDATVRAMTQRLAAAQKLGGDVDKLPDGTFPAGAFCTRPSAPPAVRAAIAVIRDAAVLPDDLLARTNSGADLISTKDLIEGTAPGGSVRQRLAEFYWGVLDPPMGVQATLPNGETVESQYHLELQTFQEAREYLRDEFAAFARSKAAELKRRVKPDGTLATYHSYAGTGTAPTRLPSAYYGALTRGSNSVHSEGSFDGFDTEPQYNASFTRFIAAARQTIGYPKRGPRS